jgi:hypothetical protein
MRRRRNTTIELVKEKPAKERVRVRASKPTSASKPRVRVTGKRVKREDYYPAGTVPITIETYEGVLTDWKGTVIQTFTFATRRSAVVDGKSMMLQISRQLRANGIADNASVVRPLRSPMVTDIHRKALYRLRCRAKVINKAGEVGYILGHGTDWERRFILTEPIPSASARREVRSNPRRRNPSVSTAGRGLRRNTHLAVGTRVKHGSVSGVVLEQHQGDTYTIKTPKGTALVRGSSLRRI